MAFTTKKHYYVITSDDIEITRLQYPLHNTDLELQVLENAIDTCVSLVIETGKDCTIKDTFTGNIVTSFDTGYIVDCLSNQGVGNA